MKYRACFFMVAFLLALGGIWAVSAGAESPPDIVATVFPTPEPRENYIGFARVRAAVMSVHRTVGGEVLFTLPRNTGVFVLEKRVSFLDESWYVIRAMVRGKNRTGFAREIALEVAPDFLSGVRQVSASQHHLVCLKTNGTVVAVGHSQNHVLDVRGFDDITQVSAGYYSTMALQAGGAVIDRRYHLRGDPEWTGIAKLVNGYSGSGGISEEGAVSLYFDTYHRPDDLSLLRSMERALRRVTDLAIGDGFVAGLHADGTVTVVGKAAPFYAPDVRGWTGIVALSVGPSHLIGLKADGTAVAVRDARRTDRGECTVQLWQSLQAVAATDGYSMGLTREGTVLTTADWLDLSAWHDIEQIDAAPSYAVGLRADGVVVMEGTYRFWEHPRMQGLVVTSK